MRYRFSDITINYDSKRVPLSAKQREEREKKYPYYGAQGIIDYIDDYIFDGKYLLIAEDGENLKSKKQKIAQLANGRYWVNNHAHIVQTNEKCLIEYLYYIFNITDISGYITGSAQPKLNQANLNAIELEIPPIQQQEKVVTILSALDNKIELNQKINENLERQAQTIFVERFSGFSANNLPDGWKTVRLGDVAIISKKSFNPNKEPETLLEHYSIPAFDEARFPVFELSTSIKSNKFIVDADCFMISKLNPTTKRVWRPYCISDKAACSTEFIVYKAREQRNTDFLYSLIDSKSFTEFMCSHVTGSTGSRQRTTPADTLQFEFALPPAEEISAFTAIVQPMYQQMKANAIENDKLKRLRDTLLPKLMAGEIDILIHR